jgi:hypothetical protein
MKLTHVGLSKPATWDEVEALVRELIALEGIRNVSPPAYARRFFEAHLAEVHAQRHLARATPERRRRLRRIR